MGTGTTIVEVSPHGKVSLFAGVKDSKCPGGAGDLFGLAVKPGADAVYFVDDFGSDNNLQLFF